MAISPWDAERTTQRSEELGKLLCDSVNGGASLGFVAPLEREAAWAYWIEVARRLAAGGLQLLVLEQAGEVIGAVQLREANAPDATHRAEVAMLMVRTLYRQRGHGRQLLLAVQALARSRGRTTLLLQARAGDRSERLLAALGWVRSGELPRFARDADGSYHAAGLHHLTLD